MPDKRCKNGHRIDESVDLCPYCPPDTPFLDDSRDEHSPFARWFFDRMEDLAPQTPEPGEDSITIKGALVSTPHGPALTVSVRHERSGDVQIAPGLSLIGQEYGYVHNLFPALRLSRRQLDDIIALCDSFLEADPETMVVNDVLYRFNCKVLCFRPVTRGGSRR